MLLLRPVLSKFMQLKNIRMIYANNLLLQNSKVEVGSKASLTRTILAEDIEKFCVVSGDTNPVHSGAKAVVHGAFLNAMVSCVMGTKIPGAGSMVVSQALRYPNPCNVGETVSVSVIVTGMKADLIKCRYVVMAQQGDDVMSSRPVLTGEASLITIANQKKRAAKNKNIVA